MERPAPTLGTESETLFARILAFVVDGILLAVVGFVLIGVLGMSDPGVAGVFGGVFGLLAFAYFVVMEGTYGQTIGKRVLGIVVVKDDGSACTMGASLIRNLLRVIDTLPTAYILGIVLILVTDGQRLGDIVGSTYVVKTRS